MKNIVLIAVLLVLSKSVTAQGTLSGDLMLNANFFQRDSAINAANNPLYDNYLSGGEAWLGVRYNYKGFTATLRADAFHNSNLFVPTQAMNGFGIGAWSLSKDLADLSITVGYIYDQIGTGVMFRAYEDRGLLIDNALVGVRLKYQLTKNVFVKAFTGQQKFIFERYKPIIKGANVEGDFSIGKANLIPGLGALNRTIDQNTIDTIVSTINSQAIADRFIPKYNMYAFTAYNTLTIGGFSWFIEGSFKTEEAISKDNMLKFEPGNVLYTTLGYATKGIAANVTAKRTENYIMRTSPIQILNRGMLNWQPIVARMRPQRLMARYTPASQDISEMAIGADLLLSPNDNFSVIMNGTYINTLADVTLYREGYIELDYRGVKDWIFNGGFQYMEYNQEVYQVIPAVPLVKSMIPFIEATHRFTKKVSLRTEWEYQSTQQDFGSWLFGLVELTVAPKWSFAVSDMYNIVKGPRSTPGASNHFYNIFAAYTKGPHRFTLSYVKQVEGINCTGGVCRYEPAFSGVRFGCTSQF